MASFNKVYLMGNLTRDPEIRSLPSGQTVTELGLASSRTYTKDGEKREEVAFVDVTFWGKAGEVIAQYLYKGDPIFVEGRLHFRQWEDKNGGGKRSKLSVTGDNFQFIGGKSKGGGSGDGAGGVEKRAGDLFEPASGGSLAPDEVPF